MPARHLHPTRWALAAGVAVLVVPIAVAWFVLRPADGHERIKAEIDWPEDCASIETTAPSRSPATEAWSGAVQTATVSCEFAGPFFIYARFASRSELRAELLAHPPDAPVCLARTEVVIDGLDAGFRGLCRTLSGDVVDAVSALPKSGGESLDEIERGVARDRRRATAAQSRALQQRWSRGSGARSSR